jgi:oligoendopeptidase F
LGFCTPVPDARRARKLLDSDALQAYRHYLDDIWRMRAHRRSPEVEQVVAGSSLPGDAHVRAFRNLNDADIEWPKLEDPDGATVTASPAQYGTLMLSDDRDFRQRAYVAYMGTVADYVNTYSATLGGKIQRDVWLARVYNYESSLDAALAGPNVPRSVMDTLLAAVHDNMDSIHSYAEMRKKVIGVDELRPWDGRIPLVEGGGRDYSFDEAWELAMQFWRETYGEEYAAIAQQAREQRWIDVYSNKGKRGGAYSWGTYREPYYLFLNWGGKFDDVSTLVHEMGHSVHGVLADRANPYHDSNFDLFVAEVGSVASETLFNSWLLERTEDPQQRLVLLEAAVDGIRGTFITQIFFHEWEAAAHAMAESGEALTAESMSKVYSDLSALYGGEATVPHEYSPYGWSRIPHFYRNFYVWKYATSYAAGAALAERFRRGDRDAARDYLAMLKLGGSRYPLDILKAGGIDLTDPAVINSVMARYGELVAQLEKELLGT